MITGDSDFPRAPGFAAAALTVSAALLCVLSWVVFQITADGGGNTSHTRTLQGGQFKAIFGTTEVRGNHLVVTAAAERDGNYHVLVTSKASPFRAADHPVLEYDLQGLNPGLVVNLIWRSGGRLYSRPLSQRPDGVFATDLSAEAAWQGSVSEIGLHIQGDLRGSTLELRRLTLLPDTWTASLAATWSGWAAFKGVTPSSINVLYGAADRNGLSPTLIAAAWAALALTMIFLAGRKYPLPGRTTCAIALLFTWIALDLQWQRDLSLQLAETKHHFAGKSVHDKHLADWGAPIYLYTQRLKREVLPEENSRIFILHQQSSGHNFDRLRTQYQLLPHNIYNYGMVPPDAGVRQGDYILGLGELPALQYRDGHLLWQGGRPLPVELVDSDPLGILYRVVPDRPSAQAPAEAGRG